MKRSLLLSVIVVLLTGCGKPLPNLEGVDLVAWKEDRQGCLGKRVPFEESLRNQREKLKGLSEIEVVEMLGRPDLNDLSERNVKYYYFYIDPGPTCANGDSTGTALIIRFNATGIAREVAIE
jgi:hypothetical protein